MGCVGGFTADFVQCMSVGEIMRAGGCGQERVIVTLIMDEVGCKEQLNTSRRASLCIP